MRKNQRGLACDSAASSLNMTVNCIFSTYPQGSGLTAEMFEEILAQHWAMQNADGMYSWHHLGKMVGNSWQPITPQEAYDMYVQNDFQLSNNDNQNAMLVSVNVWNPEDVPSHIAPYIQGYFLEELGCTDPYAENFSQTANTDDGSCYYIGGAGAEEGCKNQNALNFNPDPNVSACEDCCVMDYVGCTDATAVNFDPVATEPCNNCCDYIGSSSDDDSMVYIAPSESSDLFSTENIALAAGGIVVIGLVIYALKK